MRKLLLTVLFLFTFGVNGFCAWSPTRPTDSEKLKDTPALIRGNWDAIATGTDSALLVTDAKVSASANIADTKLGSITTAGKVSGSALTSLSSTPSGAGALPLVNGGTGQTTRQASLDALLDTQTGNAGKALVTNGTNASLGFPSSLTIASATTGDLLYYNGSAWVRLAPGTSGYALKSTGAGSAPAYSQVDLSGTNVTGTLPISGGGTGQTTASTAINALLPAQGSASDKFLTTNGSSASWGTVTQYSPSVYTGTLTESTSGASADVSVTGVGFHPTSIDFIVSSGSYFLSSGHCSSLTNRTYSYGILNNSSGGTGIGIWRAGGAGGTLVAYQIADIVSFDADGFTYHRTRYSGSGGDIPFYISYIARK